MTIVQGNKKGVKSVTFNCDIGDSYLSQVNFFKYNSKKTILYFIKLHAIKTYGGEEV
jgi:hypothetical protein